MESKLSLSLFLKIEKGIVYDPKLDGSCDINYGLRLARSLLLDINNLGLPWYASNNFFVL